MEAGQRLTHSELMTPIRDSNILRTYQFKEAIARRTMTMDIAADLELGLADQEFRGNFPAYRRTIDRQLQNEFNENNARWEVADTYDHTRGIP